MKLKCRSSLILSTMTGQLSETLSIKDKKPKNIMCKRNLTKSVSCVAEVAEDQLPQDQHHVAHTHRPRRCRQATVTLTPHTRHRQPPKTHTMTVHALTSLYTHIIDLQATLVLVVITQRHS